MNSLDIESITNVAALLVHAAKIDEKYSIDEKKLINNFIRSYTKDKNSNEILKKAEGSELTSGRGPAGIAAALHLTHSRKRSTNGILSAKPISKWKQHGDKENLR